MFEAAETDVASSMPVSMPTARDGQSFIGLEWLVLVVAEGGVLANGTVPQGQFERGRCPAQLILWSFDRLFLGLVELSRSRHASSHSPARSCGVVAQFLTNVSNCVEFTLTMTTTVSLRTMQAWQWKRLCGSGTGRACIISFLIVIEASLHYFHHYFHQPL